MGNLHPQEVSEKNIWDYRQNYPRLVIRDIIEEFKLEDDPTAYKRIQNILMARGVNKWLKCRKDIIHLKNSWLKQIQELMEYQTKARKVLGDRKKRKRIEDLGEYKKKVHKNAAYLNALIQCRQEVRNICHSERWVEERDIK